MKHMINFKCLIAITTSWTPHEETQPKSIRPVKARTHLPCPPNLHCVKDDSSFDGKNGFRTYCVGHTDYFHWHNDEI